jgi:hypothetical protein
MPPQASSIKSLFSVTILVETDQDLVMASKILVFQYHWDFMARKLQILRGPLDTPFRNQMDVNPSVKLGEKYAELGLGAE